MRGATRDDTADRGGQLGSQAASNSDAVRADRGSCAFMHALIKQPLAAAAWARRQGPRAVSRMGWRSCVISER